MRHKTEDILSEFKVYCHYDELLDPSTLKDHDLNRNTHPQEQIERLVLIFKENGIRRPITVSNLSGSITKGHGRKLAAIRAGIKEYPVEYQDYESPEQEYQDIQADNAIALWSFLDLKAINADLPTIGPLNIDALGIKDFTLDMADKEGLGDDSVPEIDKSNVKTQPGDVYQIGEHILMCGDSTDKESVEHLMDGQKASITFTSPPYNLGNAAKLRGNGKDTVYTEKSDHKTEEEYLSFLNKWTRLAIDNSKNVFCNIQLLAGNKFIMHKYWGEFSEHLVDIMIWDKQHGAPAMAPRVFNSTWEFIFIFANEERPTRAVHTGKDFRGTIENIYRLNPVGKKDEDQKDHGAVFPMPFAEYFIEQFADDTVLDLFGGSGTTMLASEKKNKKCFMMEMDPYYCDVIVTRMCKFRKNQKVLLNGEALEWPEPHAHTAKE